MTARQDEIEDQADGVVRLTREDFIRDYWDYKAGQHVTILAPSGGGKTQFSFELLGATATPECPAYVLVMKERDKTVSMFAKRFHFRILKSWPPPTLIKFQKKPPGYVVWPPGNPNVHVEKARHANIFARVIQWLYWSKGKKILFADESYSLEKELGLVEEINRIHTKGRGMDCGLWCASQRPAWISQWAYQANHVFIGNDPDRKARERYGEIASGIDPAVIREVNERLAPFEFLYINREHKTMCIVEAS